jgi:hypothetical protein
MTLLIHPYANLIPAVCRECGDDAPVRGWYGEVELERKI